MPDASALQTIRFKILRAVPGSTPARDLPYCDVLLAFEHGVLDIVVSDERRREINRLLDAIDPALHPVCRQLKLLTCPFEPYEWIQLWLRGAIEYFGGLQLESPQCCCTGDATAAGQEMLFRVDCLSRLSASCIHQALSWSVAIWRWAADSPSSTVDIQAAASRLRVNRGTYKPGYVAMAKALTQRNIPWLLVDYVDTTPLLLAGHGRLQRSISHMLTDTTSSWALSASKSKRACREMLRDAGIPVAVGGFVASCDVAIQIADRIGYPVVVKPNGADQGEGVITNITNSEKLRDAFLNASQHGSGVVLEKMVPGHDYRFYIVNGRVMAAMQRIPAGVTGDGTSTIRELIESLNITRTQTPLCMEGSQYIFCSPIAIDDEAKQMLSHQGLDLQDIPAAGLFVRLRFTANFSRGGTVRECLSDVHPQVTTLLARVAALMRLDVAGVDVMAPTISQPLEDVGGVIIEVNGMPGIIPHMIAEPDRCLMDETALELLQWSSSQVPPLVAFLGPVKESDVMWLENELRTCYPLVAVSSRTYLRSSGGDLHRKPGHLFGMHRQTLRDPLADAFLLEIDCDDLMSNGLAWPECDLLIMGEQDKEDLPEQQICWLQSRAHVVMSWTELREPAVDSSDQCRNKGNASSGQRVKSQQVKPSWWLEILQQAVQARLGRYTRST